MRLKLHSYTSTAINDGTNYRAFIPQDMPLQGDVNHIFINRPQKRPKWAGSISAAGKLSFTIEMLGAVSSQIDTLKALFNPDDLTEKKLIIKDADNSDKQWYIMAVSKPMTNLKRKSVTINLEFADPVWYEETESSDSWSITASGQTRSITPVGNLPTRPRFVLTPTQVGVAGYAYKKFIPIHNPIAFAQPNYPRELVTAWDTAALVTASKMLATGNDLRVFVDGAEVSRWHSGINTTTTKLWIAIDFKVKRELTLGLAIAHPHTTLTTITYANTAANNTAAAAMSASGILRIDDELFTYAAINKTTRQFTGVVPTVKGSSSAAHTLGATIRWIEHDVWVMYGNPAAVDPSTGVDNYDDRKPIFNLSTSTNTSWVYEEFYEIGKPRAGAWTPAKTGISQDPINNFGYYTGDKTALADPATEMGMSLYAWQVGNVWKTALGTIEWRLYNPAGATTVTATGERYRYTTNWPSLVFQKSLNGIFWTTVWTEVTPAVVQTWTALVAHSGVALSGNFPYLRFMLTGTIGATASNAVHYEIEAKTVVWNSSNVPQGSIGAEQNNYHLQARITNNTSGEYIDLNWGMILNTSLTIDCENKLVYSSDNTNAAAAIRYSSVRQDWLNLAAGANTLLFTDPGTAGLTFVSFWRSRNS